MEEKTICLIMVLLVCLVEVFSECNQLFKSSTENLHSNCRIFFPYGNDGNWLKGTSEANGADSLYFGGKCKVTIDDTLYGFWNGYDRFIFLFGEWYEIVSFEKTGIWKDKNEYYRCSEEEEMLKIYSRDYGCSEIIPCYSYIIYLKQVEVVTCLDAVISYVSSKWGTCSHNTTTYDSKLWSNNEAYYNREKLFLTDNGDPVFPDDECFEKAKFNCFSDNQVVSLDEVKSGGDIRVFRSCRYGNRICEYGNCTSSDHCECFTDFYGDGCDLWECYGEEKGTIGVCSGKGNCSAHDTCICDENFGYLKDCSSCFPGFVGEDCSIWNQCLGVTEGSYLDEFDLENTKYCNGHGVCMNPNDRNKPCVCDKGYHGGHCEMKEETYQLLLLLLLTLSLPMIIFLICFVYCLFLTIIICFIITSRKKYPLHRGDLMKFARAEYFTGVSELIKGSEHHEGRDFHLQSAHNSFEYLMNIDSEKVSRKNRKEIKDLQNRGKVMEDLICEMKSMNSVCTSVPSSTERKEILANDGNLFEHYRLIINLFNIDPIAGKSILELNADRYPPDVYNDLRNRYIKALEERRKKESKKNNNNNKYNHYNMMINTFRKPIDELNDHKEFVLKVIRDGVNSLSLEFSNLEVSACLGKGCYGIVYSCRIKEIPIIPNRKKYLWLTNHDFALKIPRKFENVNEASRECLDISHHPNVVDVIYVTKNLQDIDLTKLPHHEIFWNFEEKHKKGVFILMMSYQKSLLTYISERKDGFCILEIVYMTEGLLRGGYHLQKHRVVHRDLHLGNIFVNPFCGMIVIGDFGCSVQKKEGEELTFGVNDDEMLTFDSGTTGIRKLVGAPAYRPPEIQGAKLQWEKHERGECLKDYKGGCDCEKPVDFSKVDIFMIGRVSKELLHNLKPNQDLNGFSSLVEDLTKDFSERIGYEEAIRKVVEIRDVLESSSFTHNESEEEEEEDEGEGEDIELSYMEKPLIPKVERECENDPLSRFSDDSSGYSDGDDDEI